MRHIVPGSVTLTCLVSNKGGECRWQKDGKVRHSLLYCQLLIMIVQPVGMYPGKYSLSSSPGDCSLSLQEVDIRLDDGQWQCQVTI